MPDQNSRALPPNVHEKSGTWWYVYRDGGKRKWVKLCRVRQGEAELYRQLTRVTAPYAQNVADLLRMFLKEGMLDLSPNTQKDYENSSANLIRVFGHMRPDEIREVDIAQYLELRKQQGAPVRGNREKSCLSSAYNFWMRKGYASRNPCHGVRRNREKPVNRYIRDDEWQMALDNAEPAYRELMLAAYYTGLRKGDLRRLRKENITDEGILLEESKTGKRTLILWHDDLKTLCEAAQARSQCDRVFTNRRGQPWGEWATQSAHARLMKKLPNRFRFHDIRAKAESDHESGMGMMSRYKRARRITPVEKG